MIELREPKDFRVTIVGGHVEVLKRVVHCVDLPDGILLADEEGQILFVPFENMQSVVARPSRNG